MALTKITSTNIQPGAIESSALETSGATAGTYGAAAKIPVLSVNAQGIVYAISEVDVAGVTGFTFDSGTEVLTISTADGNSFDADVTYFASKAYADQAETDAKAYADTLITNLVDTAPTTLDTLNELAAALGDDPNFATTISTSLGTKVDKINITGATVGSASQVPVITFNSQGQITSATTTAVAGVSSTDYNISTGVLTINTSDGGSFTEDLGVGNTDAPIFSGVDVTNNLAVGGVISSTIATGTAPLTVASSTKVTNLNADFLDGLDAVQFVRTDTSSTINNGDLTGTNSSITAGWRLSIDSSGGARTYLALDSDTTDGLGAGSDYVYIGTDQARFRGNVTVGTNGLAGDLIVENGNILGATIFRLDNTTESQRDAMSSTATVGDMIFNSTLGKYQVWDGTDWLTLGNSPPTWVTSAGSLGSVFDIDRSDSTFTVQASDPEGGQLTYSVTGGSLPAGASLNSSTGVISGFSQVGSDTTSTFDITVTDSSGASVSREFSITVKAPIIQTFTYTGGNQTWTKPAGVSKIQAKVWGAAGGAGTSYSAPYGGPGGYGYANVDVSSFSSLTVVVGQGGVSNGTGQQTTYGHLLSSTDGLPGGFPACAGGGGGLSGLFKDATFSQADAIIISGGGGGSGQNTTNVNYADGGAGGGVNQNGQQGYDSPSSSTAQGRGGTLSAGGQSGIRFFVQTNGDASSSVATDGSALCGGHAHTACNWTEGGGGGAGYFGGGSGAHEDTSGWWGTGGGGSGYANPTYCSNAVGYTGTYKTQSSQATSDSDWVSGTSRPRSGNTGENGLVVIRY